MKKEPPTELVAFLAGRFPPSSFLKALRLADRWSFAIDDVEQALVRHRELDPRFSKSSALLRTAMLEKDERFVRPVSDIVREALIRRLSDIPHWIGSNWYELQVEERAYRVADVVSRRISDKKRGPEAQHLLASTLLLLAQEGLDAETAFRASARGLGATAETTPRWNRDRVLYVAGPRSKVSELRVVVQAVLPLIDQLDAARDAAEAQRREAARDRALSEEQLGVVRDLRQAVDSLKRDREDLGRRVATLEEELRSALVHGSHDLDRLRSGAVSFLQGRLRSLLETAEEAFELDPPRPHIAKEKIDVLRDALEEQIKWLEQ